VEVERRVFKEKQFTRFALVVLTMGCLAHFINDGYLRILSPISPLIMEEYMLNYTQIGLLNTVLNVSAALLQILTGFLTFHFRRRSLIILGFSLVFNTYIFDSCSFGVFPASNNISFS